MEMPKRIISILFLVLILCLIVSSFFPQESASRFFYQAAWFKIMWAALSAGLLIGLFDFVRKRLFTFGVIYLGLLLILLGGLLTSLLGEEGFIEIKEGQSADGYWVEDELFRPLNFSLHLKDFSVELYPEEKKGMRFVKSYKAFVSIAKGREVLKTGAIEVNRPLSFEGFSFYQYGYDEGLPHQTILQVVKDPGLYVVYLGFLIVLFGLLTSFKKIWS